ncbi:MAG: hypothetical protein JSS89_01370 [Bacteroidetes bacterium]|nr:hypothetical protein [Bacteroidota bacterium]
MWIIFLLTLALVCERASAQPQLRVERLGLPPYVGNVKILSGRVYLQSYDGLYVFDASTHSWASLGAPSKSMVLSRDMTEHPNGLVVAHVPEGTVRFQPLTNSFSLESGVFHAYQVVVFDSVVGAIRVDGETTARCVWKQWPSLDEIRTDTVDLGGEHAYSDLIPCNDGSVLAFSRSKVIRFRYDGVPTVIELGDQLLRGGVSYYVDRDRTRIALHADRGILVSNDLFTSWIAYGDSLTSVYARFHLVSDTNVIVAVDRGVLTRFDRDVVKIATLLKGTRIGWNVTASDSLVVVGQADSILFVGTAHIAAEHLGLRERSARHLYAVDDGLIATEGATVLVHPSGGQWTTCAFGPNTILHSGSRPWIVPAGGTSIDDFWLTASDQYPVHIRPRDSIFKWDVFFPNIGSSGFYPNDDASYFTVLYALDQDCGSRQVVWLSGNSPIRTLLCKDDLQYLMAFNGRDLVAITHRGTLWRTLDGDPATWIELPMPTLSLQSGPRMITKKDHGLLTDMRTRVWTHDGGRTWESFVDSAQTMSTLTHTGTIITARIEGATNAQLIIDVHRNGTSSRFTSLTSDLIDFARNPIRDIAFDDNEQRLFVTTTYYTASLDMSGLVSVAEPPIVKNEADQTSLGVYDLFGRRVAATEEEVGTSGLYLVVFDRGVRKILIQR